MHKKILVLLNNNEFYINEPTLWDYKILLYDKNLFLKNIFNEDIKLNNKQFEIFISELFELSNLKENLLNKNNNSIEKLHITIAQFMKFFWISYNEVLAIPFLEFQKIIKDIKIISWEKEPEDDKILDKKDIKKLLLNQM